MFVDYLVFEISGNSNGAHIRKREKHKNFIPFYVLLSFLTRGYAKRRNGFLLGLRYANVSLAHSGVESS